MRSIKKFNQKNWNCTGNFGFFDRDEQILREGDLTASNNISKTIAPLKDVSCFFQIVGEVKKSAKPWVVFKETIKKPSVLSFSQIRIDAFNNLIHHENLPCQTPKFAKYIHRYSLLDKLDWLAYGLHESFKRPDQPSRWHSACIKVCKGAEHVLSSHIELAQVKKKHEAFANNISFIFVKPIVILDGLLFSAELDENSATKIEQIKYAMMNFEFQTKNYRRLSYRIDLVNIDDLESYIDLMDRRQKNIFDGILKEANL